MLRTLTGRELATDLLNWLALLLREPAIRNRNASLGLHCYYASKLQDTVMLLIVA